MKQKVKLRKTLKAYLRWPIWLSILLLCMNVSVYLLDRKIGLLISAYVVVYIVVVLFLYRYKRPVILRELVQYGADYAKVQKVLLREMPLPYGILDVEGHLLWGNDEMLDVIVNEKAARRNIANVFPEITCDDLPEDEQDVIIHITKEDKNFRVILRLVIAEDFEETLDQSDMGNFDGKNALVCMYLYDETQVKAYIRENKEQRQVVGLLYIDNYEESLENIDEVRRSLLVALIDRKINKYMQSIDAIIKRLEKDKYIFVFQHKYLSNLQTAKFSLLEEVRAINIGNEMAVTLSIGLGVNADTYMRSYDYARAAIDLALGRGGDQAVVKEGEKLSYYGGKSIQVEKSTRVKARVKAHALRETIEARERVVIMGHSMADVDCFGAAVGVYRIAKTIGKKAYIVVNNISTSVKPIMDRFKNNPEYEEDMIITGDRAKEIVDSNTTLVVVDVNRPSYTECPELLVKTKTIVILDHHRQSGEAIENAVLSYIEPYASSACELVAEILQYIGEDLKLRVVEADAMYSGIMIDTNNFLTKTGVRTFEAAAYLRRNGADITRVRKVFRGDMAEYKVKAEAIQHAEVYLNHYAITECRGDGQGSPTVLGAQVANQLLDISNIKASFVLTGYNNKIYVSARSIDELNVQVVMEKLGGGGHMSVAGAQLTGCTMEEAMKTMRETLQNMNEEGDL